MIARLLNLFALDFAPDPAGPPDVYRHLRRNWFLYTAAVAVWFAGSSFFTSNTILPVFAYRLTGSTFVVSLVPALFDAGWFLPSLLVAPLVERRARVKPLTLWLGAIQRSSYLALALAVIWMAGLHPGTAQWIFIALVVFISMANGFPASASTEIQARMMPVSRRGRLVGSALLIGQFFSIGAAQAAVIILDRLPFPTNFALAFLIGSGCMWASLIFNAFYAEPVVKPAPPRPAGTSFVGRLAKILKQNPNFRIYLLSRATTYLGGMAVGFVAVYGVERFGLSDSTAAVFAGILYGTSMVGFGLWGALGDRHGYKRVLMLSVPMWLAALVLLLLAPGGWVFYVAFALLGLSSTGATLADLTMSIEFGPEAERPTYFGLARTVTAPALLVAPLVGGWIVQRWGYQTMLAVSFAISTLGLLIMGLKVREPRHLRVPMQTADPEAQPIP